MKLYLWTNDKIEPWEANDYTGDYAERGFYPKSWQEVTDFDDEFYGLVCTDFGWGFVNYDVYLIIPDEYDQIFTHILKTGSASS